MDADLSIGAPGAPQVNTEAGDEPAEALEAPPELVEVSEEQVRSVLGAAGLGLNYVLGDEDVHEHWQFTERELDQLTPPLTRYVNRRPKLREAVLRSDEITIAVVLAEWAGRNVADWRTAREARSDEDVEDEAPGAEGRSHATPRDDAWEWGGEDGAGIPPAAGGAGDRTVGR